MFMTASEIMKATNTSKDLQGNETMDDLWKRKLKESKDETGTRSAGLFDKIASEGYRGDPIELDHDDSSVFTSHLPESVGSSGSSPTFDKKSNMYVTEHKKTQLMDGHHRVATMAEADPNAWIPVTHKTRKQQFGGFKAPRMESTEPDDDSGGL
jgi:hypothetical protein